MDLLAGAAASDIIDGITWDASAFGIGPTIPWAPKTLAGGGLEIPDMNVRHQHWVTPRTRIPPEKQASL